jgi:hypothetical protein
MGTSPIAVGVGNSAEAPQELITPAQGIAPPAQGQPPGANQAEFVFCDQAIEVFHKVLKSGCRAEEARLRTAERLVKLIALFCILSWRVFWMTMINRSAPHAVPGLALTETELVLLDRLVPDKPQARTSARTLSSYLIKVARLGGYLARSRDPPPGNIVMWRGLSRLTDITLGAKLARTAPICG